MAAWLYRRPDSKKYWIGWRANGRQFLKSTGTDDEKKAKEKLRDFEFLERAKSDGKLTEQFIESLTQRPLSQLSLKAALTDWLAECKGSTDPNTYERYADIAEQFSGFIGVTESKPLLRDVTTDEVRAFLIHKNLSVAASTVNLYRRVLSTFFIRALKTGHIRANPVLPIKKFKQSKNEAQRRRALTLEELKLIYSKAPTLFWRYMILGGFFTGLRMGDLICMKWGSVDFNENVIRLVTIKTDKPVQIPIAPQLRSVLCEAQRDAGTIRPSNYIWPEKAAHYQKYKANSFSQEFYEDVLTPAGLATKRTHKVAKGKAKGRNAKRNLSGVSFHCLRHSFISFLKMTGSNNAIAKELAGHSSDAVNSLYTHMPMETLSNAINQLPEVTS